MGSQGHNGKANAATIRRLDALHERVYFRFSFTASSLVHVLLGTCGYI